MRVCLVSREFQPFFGGGIGTYAMLMARALHEAGHEVHVLTANHPALAERGQKLFPGIRLHGVTKDLGPAAENASSYGCVRHALGVYSALEKLHAKHPFDVIEFPEYFGEGSFALQAKRYLGKFREALMVVRLHTPTWDCRQLNRQSALDAETVFLEEQERTSILLADLVLSPTHSLLTRVEGLLGKLSRAEVNPHPFDMAEWKREMAKSLPVPASRPQVLYFGRLEYRKGVHQLVLAGQQLLEKGLDVEFLMIGADTATGPFGQSMRGFLQKRVAKKWQSHFLFEPRRSRSELISAIRAATVCAFPSHWENFPNVCLEAMATGATVVGSDQGGMAEVIEDGVTGLLCRGGDVDSLASALERALGDHALRARIAPAAKQRVAEYCSPARVSEQFTGFISAAREALSSTEVSPEFSSRDRERPAVSIIIPFYNLGRFLPETLRSIKSQTFTDYEVVIVDDGSTDPDSLTLLEVLEGGPWRIVRKPNGGLSSARNAGVRAARGQWILPLDADDIIAPTFLERAVSALRSNPEAGYVTSFVDYFSDDPAHPFGGWIPLGGNRDCLPIMNTASTCTALIPKEHIEAVGGYDEWLTSFEDWDLYCSLAEAGFTGVVLPEFLFHYRIRGDSMMRTTAVSARHELVAYLVAKHPGLAVHPDRTIRVLLSELERLGSRRNADQPLRYAIADQFNLAVKRLPVLHPALKRTAVAATETGLVHLSGDDKPLRYVVADQIHAAVSGNLTLGPAVRTLGEGLQRLIRPTR